MFSELRRLLRPERRYSTPAGPEARLWRLPLIVNDEERAELSMRRHNKDALVWSIFMFSLTVQVFLFFSSLCVCEGICDLNSSVCVCVCAPFKEFLTKVISKTSFLLRFVPLSAALNSSQDFIGSKLIVVVKL